MSNMISQLYEMEKKETGYWSQRILYQLKYAHKISKISEGAYNSIINDAMHLLLLKYEQEGAVTKKTALETEEVLTSLSESAKKYKIICTAHAHIDMNWMWGYDETVAITLDTFRTMLKLMKEYPDFTFSQSQASVYRMVEEHDPEMLEEIKIRIKEGRWEVTAATWVEADKNMPNGESQVRQILYTKKYLSALLDIKPETLILDFEPDTFGHSCNVPEILSLAGIKYYYYCRGSKGRDVFRWEAPSGNRIIAFCEPKWYNMDITPSMALSVPEYCNKYGIDTALRVYGVGDHGGGPTRRDIERIIDMSAWPIFPQIKFGTYQEYFSQLEKIAEKLPIYKGELNPIFTGCYSSQSRIKMANRVAEVKLNQTEIFSSLSSVFTGYKDYMPKLEKAWEKVLFNQFHDIIPGSGVMETREFALGEFQKAMAIINTEESKALRHLASSIDTRGLIEEACDYRNSSSEGAGVGFGINKFRVQQCESGRGKNRIYHFFNPSSLERTELAELIVWDWDGDKDHMIILNGQGKVLKHQIGENEVLQYLGTKYWGHTYLKVFIEVALPPYGYTTCTLGERKKDEMTDDKDDENLKQEMENCYVLENELVKVIFSNKDLTIRSMIDKASGDEMVDSNHPAGIFRLIYEEASKEMTSWVVSRYMNVKNLCENITVKSLYINSTALRQWIKFEVKFLNSYMNISVSLDRNSASLDYQVEGRWLEIGKGGDRVPQLSFYMPVGYKCNKYKFDVPFGTIERDQVDMDVVANSWALGVREEFEKKRVMILTDSKYGFRCVDDSISITLVRGSCDPDPAPDIGNIRFRFAVCLTDLMKSSDLIRMAYHYSHPISFISGTVHEGNLPISGSFLAIEKGKAVVSALKRKEQDPEGDKLILRVYEADGTAEETTVRFVKSIKRAYLLDVCENAIDRPETIVVDGDALTVQLDPYRIETICVEF